MSVASPVVFIKFVGEQIFSKLIGYELFLIPLVLVVVKKVDVIFVTSKFPDITPLAPVSPCIPCMPCMPCGPCGPVGPGGPDVPLKSPVVKAYPTSLEANVTAPVVALYVAPVQPFPLHYVEVMKLNLYK